MLKRPVPKGTQNRLRLQVIHSLHPALGALASSLASALGDLDDYDEADRLDLVLRWLPNQEAYYLPFDAIMAEELLGYFQCQEKVEKLEVIPSYWSEWQHGRTRYLVRTPAGLGYRPITFVRIRRDPQDAPRLDDMIWMSHEIGHQLLFENIDLLRELFAPAWQQFLGDMAVHKLNAKGHTLDMAQEYEGKMDSYWRADTGRANWTHELVIDALCVWVFGPAYLWAFVEEYIDEAERHEPHQLDFHPPRRLRAEALYLAARQFGWSEADCLKPLLQAWKVKPDDASEANHYTAFRKPYLVEGVHGAAVDLATHLGIAQLTPTEFTALDPLEALNSDASARDVILGAWKQRNAFCSLHDLQSWEEKIVAQAMSET